MVKAGVVAGRTGQVGGQAVIVAWVCHQRELSVEQVSHAGHRRLQAVHREGDMAAVEMTAVQHALFVRIDQRIVVGAVQLGFDPLPRPIQRVFQNADHMRRAAQRIAVLQPVRVARRVHVAKPAADRRSRTQLARMRFRRKKRRVEVIGIAIGRRDRAGGDRAAQPRQLARALPGQAGQACHHRGAVHDGQRLLRAQTQRRAPQLSQRIGRGHPPAFHHDVALAAQHRGDIGQRRQVAAGTDRTFGRDARQHIVRQQGSQLFQQGRADGGIPLA